MRKEYGKALREQFDELVARELPGFEPVKVKSQYVWLGERLYRWIAKEGMHCWLILVPDQKADLRFTVEIGWSRLARFPELMMRPSATLSEGEDVLFKEEECIVRLTDFWSQVDPWWGELKVSMDLSTVSKENARKKVSSMVEDAVRQVKDVGLPFLGKAIESHA